MVSPCIILISIIVIYGLGGVAGASRCTQDARVALGPLAYTGLNLVPLVARGALGFMADARRCLLLGLGSVGARVALGSLAYFGLGFIPLVARGALGFMADAGRCLILGLGSVGAQAALGSLGVWLTRVAACLLFLFL